MRSRQGALPSALLVAALILFLRRSNHALAAHAFEPAIPSRPSCATLDNVSQKCESRTDCIIRGI